MTGSGRVMVFSKLGIFLNMIKFEHTLFALPFAYVGAFLTEMKIPSTHDLLYITLAMIGARTAAMSLNRIIDRRIDARNPRTAGRALPRGLLSASEVWLYVFLSFCLLLYSSYQLSPLAFRLFPVAVLVLLVYSYTKRITWTCHLLLGAALGLAPLGSWIAIAGRFDLAPVLLMLGVLFWVAGFDIIYACDDYEFDRREGLYSIPACFGIRGRWIFPYFSIYWHHCFYSCRLNPGCRSFYLAGVVIAVVILIYQHLLVKPDDFSQAGIAFFNLNGTLSVIMLLFTFLEVICPL